MQLGDEVADSEKLDLFNAGLRGREREFVYFGRPRTYEEAKDIALGVSGARGLPEPLTPTKTRTPDVWIEVKA